MFAMKYSTEYEILLLQNAFNKQKTLTRNKFKFAMTLK